MNAAEETNRQLRMACSDSLATFAETFAGAIDPNYAAAQFHRALAAKLEDCRRRNIKRLIVSAPPRHGKTALTSILFPAWLLTQSSKEKIVLASYAQELAQANSTKIKAVLESASYRELFPDILDPDQGERAHWWHTKGGGYLFATGSGGALTGLGASVLIVDDIIRGRAEANSAAYRQAAWEWFTSTALTRLSPDGVVIVISTRWHADDLAGRLTSADRIETLRTLGTEEEIFEVVNFPALCETPETDPLGRSFGEALWAEMWPEKKLRAIEASLGPAEWNSLYQGRPNPPGGGFLNIGALRYIERSQVPPSLKLFRAWDLALGTQANHDYSCGALGGFDRETNTFYLVHLDRGRRAWLDQKARIIALAKEEAPLGGRVGIETAAAWTIAATELREALVGVMSVKGFTPTLDKEARAAGWLSLLDAGRMCIVRGAWNAAFIDELTSFPNGPHDDQIDAVSILWEMTGKPQDRLLLA